jgi:hypothetical protein
MLGIFSALIAKRIAEKKEKAAAIKASHKKCVTPCPNKYGAARLMSNFQGRVNAGSCSGVSLVLYFFMQFRVVWCHILMPCLLTFFASLT